MEPLTHQQLCTNHTEWNESYYLAFYSKDQELGGMSRIGFKPNKSEGMTFLFFFLPDGSGAAHFQLKRIKDYSESLCVGKMRHDNLSDGHWKYTFEGKMVFVKSSEDLLRVREDPSIPRSNYHVSMNLDFQAINETYEYSTFMTPESLEIGKKAGDKHWEQIAEINGEIEIDGKVYSIINAMGQRDHTYGVRDWTGVGNWLYYVIWFDKNLAINPAAIVTDDGRISSGGFLYKNGNNIPIKEIEIVDQKFRKDGVYPVSSNLIIIDNNNERHELIAKAGQIIPLPFKDDEGNESILIQSFGSFELDGRKGGHGTFETLRKAANEK